MLNIMGIPKEIHHGLRHALALVGFREARGDKNKSVLVHPGSEYGSRGGGASRLAQTYGGIHCRCQLDTSTLQRVPMRWRQGGNGDAIEIAFSGTKISTLCNRMHLES